MSEEHIITGSRDNLLASLEQHIEIEKVKDSGMAMWGMKIMESKFMPKDKAVLVDKNGDVVKVFNLAINTKEGGTVKLKKNQVTNFLKALGFQVED